MTFLRVASIVALVLLGASKATAEATYKHFASWSIYCDNEMKPTLKTCVIRQRQHIPDDLTQWVMLEIRHSDKGPYLRISTSPEARFGHNITVAYVGGPNGVLPMQCDAVMCKGEWSLGSAEINNLLASEGVVIGFSSGADQRGWRILLPSAGLKAAQEELGRAGQ